jgi:probable F420-dependent oxidoreductase
MEFGVNTSPRGALSSRQTYINVAQAAERLGFGFLSVSDHVVVPRENSSRYPYNEEGKLGAATLGHCFDQPTTLAFLAGCTRSIGLLTSVMVVPHRPPVLAAKILATADVLSDGRIRVGCGAGWLREEFEALETRPFADRGRVTDEYIAAFKELWTAEEPRYQGRHVRFADIVFAPKPVQRPHPPIWIGGESKAAMRRAVRLGDAWYPGSRNPQHRLDTPARLAAAMAELERMTEAEARDPAGIGRAYIVFSPVEWQAQPGHDSPRRLFTGSAADMAADAAALAKIGVRHLNLTFQTASADETIERMQRFAEEVMPLVKQ